MPDTLLAGKPDDLARAWRRAHRPVRGRGGISVTDDDHALEIGLTRGFYASIAAEAGEGVRCVRIEQIVAATFVVRNILDDGTSESDPPGGPSAAYFVRAYTISDSTPIVGVIPLSQCLPVYAVGMTLRIQRLRVFSGPPGMGQWIEEPPGSGGAWWAVDTFMHKCEQAGPG